MNEFSAKDVQGTVVLVHAFVFKWMVAGREEEMIHDLYSLIRSATHEMVDLAFREIKSMGDQK